MITKTRLLLALPVMVVAWLALLAVVMRAGGDAPEALVLWPSADFAAGLPAGVAITARGFYSLTVRGDGPRFVAMLYQNGALLVLPAGLAGCLPQV